MSRNWNYKRGTQEIGPISSSELKAAAASGQLRPDDLVRSDDMTKWILASKVRGLFDHVPVVPLRSQPPPLPSKAKPGPPPLPPTAKRQPPPIPVVRPAVPLDALLARLTAYARTVPHHDIKDFGNEIEITQSAAMTVYKVEVTTLFERREVVERERPHDGSVIPTVASVTLDKYDPWTEKLPPNEFVDSTWEAPVPGSASSRECNACGSEGKLDCQSCKGQAVAPCPVCDGGGGVRCSSCLGLCRVENKVPQSRQRGCRCMSGGYRGDRNLSVSGYACSTCRDTGIETYTHYASEWVQCLACQATGQQRCGGCRGHGQVTCPSCEGNGVVRCESCGGSGNVIHYLAIVQSLDPFTSAALACPVDCPDEAAKFLDSGDDFQERFARTESGTPVSVADWSLSPNTVTQIEKLRQEAAAEATTKWRAVGERVRVFSAVVYRLDYSLRGRRYTAWLPGDDRPVYAPVSPLTERAKQLVDDALTAWEGGDRRMALRSLRMALDMGKKCDHCHSVIERRRNTIPVDLYDEAGKFDLMHWLGKLFQ